MKRFSTLLTAAAVFLAVQSKAQYSENFETDPTLGGHGCIETTDFLYISKSSPSLKNLIITGDGSGYAEPPVSGASVRVFSTPYLSLPNPVTVAFDFYLTGNIPGGANRFINIGYTDATGTFQSLDSFVLNNTIASNYSKNSPYHYNQSFNLPSAMIARVTFRFGGAGGGGNCRIVYDNIAVNAPLYRGGVCNTAPNAAPNTYNLIIFGNVSGNVINDGSGDDFDAENDPLTIQSVSTPNATTEGTIIWYPDGSFTFTPIASYPGGTISLTYVITDNGYPNLTATSTITINIPAPIVNPLPVKLMNFAGSIANNKAQLKWSVAENETGKEFQVLRSVDGKNFTDAGLVFINNKVGAESYSFADAKELDAVTYYKLKIVNKDGSVSYSNVIVLKNTTAKTTTDITVLKNPVASILTFTYSASTTTQGQVAIYNSVGVKVYSSRINTQKGGNAVSLNLDSHMAAGAYIVEVVNGSERAVTRIIKQ